MILAFALTLFSVSSRSDEQAEDLIELAGSAPASADRESRREPGAPIARPPRSPAAEPALGDLENALLKPQE